MGQTNSSPLCVSITGAHVRCSPCPPFAPPRGHTPSLSPHCIASSRTPWVSHTDTSAATVGHEQVTSKSKKQHPLPHAVLAIGRLEQLRMRRGKKKAWFLIKPPQDSFNSPSPAGSSLQHLTAATAPPAAAQALPHTPRGCRSLSVTSTDLSIPQAAASWA